MYKVGRSFGRSGYWRRFEKFLPRSSSHIQEQLSRSQTSAVASEPAKNAHIPQHELKDPKPFSEVPRLSFFQTTNLMIKMLSPKLQEQIHKTQIDVQQIGDMLFTPFPSPTLQIYDPEIAAKALRNQGSTPSRGDVIPWIEYRKETGEPKALISAEGEEWQKSRSVVSKKIMPPRHVQTFEAGLVEVVDEQIENIKRRSSKFAEADPEGRRIVEELPNEMYKWAMESIGTVLFETRLGCLKDPVPTEVQGFINSINEMLKTTVPAWILFDLQKKLGSPMVKRHFKAWDNIFSFVREVVSRRKSELAKMEDATSVSKSEGAVLTYLLQEQTLSDEDIRANLTELLLGGVDTTSNTLVWAFYALSRNHEQLGRLEEEIESVLGNVPPSVKLIHKMPFLKSCIKETLRLYPVAIAMARKLENDLELGGYLVPKGTLCNANLYAMAMSEKQFAEPEKFNPARWDKKTGKDFHPFASIPFGYGPRSCIGKRLAEMEMHLMLARMVQKFHLRPAPGLPDIEPIMRLLLVPPQNQHVPVEFVPK